MGTGGEERRWKGTPRLAPLSPHPGASAPAPLYPGSSFSAYANPTNQSTHLHPRPPGWPCPRASRDECGWHGLWEGERAWGASGSPDCVGETERGGSRGEPRACLRRVPWVSEGLTREFGLYLADSGEPLGAMEQAMHHFSLVSVPLFFQGYCLSLFLQSE